MLFDSVVQWAKPMLRLVTNRHTGLWMESFFWSRWLKPDGLGKDYLQKLLNPNQPLSDYDRQFISGLPGRNVRILDVGAGPLTSIGKIHPCKKLDIVATDILAGKYEAILARWRITPIVKTIYADAEHLTDVFERDSFDYVVACNAIDHCAYPLRAVQEMLVVVKPGCYVTLQHKHNEGEHTHYAGIHQWNFDVDNGRFIIWNKRDRIDVAEEIATLGQVECRLVRESREIQVSILKRAATMRDR